MKLTGIALAAVALACLSSVPAQPQIWKPEAPPPQKVAAYVDLIRSDMTAQKRSLVQTVMQLSEADAKVFWPLYDQYQRDYYELGNETSAVIREFVDNLDKMTADRADRLMTRTMDLQKRKLAVRQNYYNMIRKALSPILAVKFAQLDSQLVQMLELQVASNLPFIR
jgi:hypothetical protein